MMIRKWFIGTSCVIFTTYPRRRFDLRKSAAFQVAVPVLDIATQALAIFRAAARFEAALLAPALARFVARHVAAAYLFAQALAVFPAEAPFRRRHVPPGWNRPSVVPLHVASRVALRASAITLRPTPPGLSEGRAKHENEQQGRERFHDLEHGTWTLRRRNAGEFYFCNKSCPPLSEVTRCFMAKRSPRYPDRKSVVK